MQREDGLLSTDDTDLGFLAAPYPAMRGRRENPDFSLTGCRLPARAKIVKNAGLTPLRLGIKTPNEACYKLFCRTSNVKLNIVNVRLSIQPIVPWRLSPTSPNNLPDQNSFGVRA